MRIWEHQIESDVIKCVQRIGEAVETKLDSVALNACYATMKPLKQRNRLPKP